MSAEVKKTAAKVTVVVVKEFLDRYTGKLCKPGDKITITTARFREINRLCEYVKTEKQIAAEKAAAEKTESDSKK